MNEKKTVRSLLVFLPICLSGYQTCNYIRHVMNMVNCKLDGLYLIPVHISWGNV